MWTALPWRKILSFALQSTVRAAVVENSTTSNQSNLKIDSDWLLETVVISDWSLETMTISDWSLEKPLTNQI